MNLSDQHDDDIINIDQIREHFFEETQIPQQILKESKSKNQITTWKGPQENSFNMPFSLVAPPSLPFSSPPLSSKAVTGASITELETHQPSSSLYINLDDKKEYEKQGAIPKRSRRTYLNKTLVDDNDDTQKQRTKNLKVI